ncbi:phosphatidate cytidylyltransferase [Phellopilus nigrolimitatus]|nr:phosphatidate cytidylyltransferase [Phellopilus nigrolimitatus]
MRQASQSLVVNPLSRKTDSANVQKSEPLPTSADPEKNGKEAESVKKRQSFLVRLLWTLIMIGGFLLCLAAGHAYMIVLVMVCQTLVYREVTALFTLGVAKTDEDEANGKDPWSKTLNWYFFAVACFFLYGESIIYYFKHVVFSDSHFSFFAANHRFISFSLYMIGFVGFVYSLQRQHLKAQFGLFCWVHMSLLVVVVSSHFIMNNILEGLIWFWVPASLVICNDIFAYIWGITIGRTPLFKLSPKKTVEGFVGAFFSTILFGQLWGTFFMRSNYMICPAQDLGVNVFSQISCTPNPVFVWRAWELPVPFHILLSALPIPGVGAIKTVPYAPYQFHLLAMSCFASLVAPFGGFFASGFKRAFDIKDFGHSIPGHGGMTDRMDCQFLMGVFTYVYYSSLIKENHISVGHVMQLIASGLTLDEQLQLMGDFRRYLEGRGISF